MESSTPGCSKGKEGNNQPVIFPPQPKLNVTNKLIRADLRAYYEYSPNGSIKCKSCPLEQKFDRARGWYNFERHLMTKHNVSKESFVKSSKVDAGTENITSFYHPPLKRKYDNSNCYSRNDFRQIAFEQDCLDLITVDGLPENALSGRGFKKLIRNRDRNLRIPSRRTVGRKLAAASKKAKKETRDCLSKVMKLHVSLDLWSAISRQSILGVKAHYIDSQWVLRTRTVGFKHFTHRKTAHNLRLQLKTLLLEELNIHPSQIASIMADNAAENIKAFDLTEFKNDALDRYDDEEIDDSDDTMDDSASDPDESDEDMNEDIQIEPVDEQDEIDLEAELDNALNWDDASFERLGCVAHALQLVVKEVLNGNNTTKMLIGVISDMVSFFHKSNTYSEKLYQKTKLHVVALGKTRWNTVLLALERVLKENFVDHVNAVYMEAKLKKISTPNPISIDTFTLLCGLYDILKPVKELTDRLQGDTITSSMVLIGIICLNNALIKLDVQVDALKPIKTNLGLALVERFASPIQHSYSGRGPRKQLLKVFDKKQYVLAALLNPTVKSIPFDIEVGSTYSLDTFVPSKDRALALLLEEISEHDDIVALPTEQSEAPVEEEPSPVTQQPKSIFDNVFDAKEENCQRQDQDGSAEDELKAYMNDKKLKSKCDPLLYWRRNQNKFPRLSKLARIYLSLPASSGSVERLFSVAGSIARAKRARMTMKKLENILIVGEWRRRQSNF